MSPFQVHDFICVSFTFYLAAYAIECYVCGLRVLVFKTSGRAWQFRSPGYCDQINEFSAQAHCAVVAILASAERQLYVHIFVRAQSLLYQQCSLL